MITKYTIEPINQLHNKAVIEISNRCFGDGYIDEKKLNSNIDINRHNFVIKLNNEVIGFCTSKILSQNNIPNDFAPFLKPENYPCGTINVIAIHPTLQQKGYGSIIFNYVLSYLSDLNCKTVIYPAWTENDRQYFLRKIERIGFAPLYFFTDFWKKDSIDRNFKCINCGSPPCTCSLRLYILEL